MDFPTYIDTIARSAPADWNVENGPLFFQPAPDPASAVLDASVSTHAFVMAFRKNLSITMAYGMLCHTHVEADFVRFFPNPASSLRYLDFFFNSALVFREKLVKSGCPVVVKGSDKLLQLCRVHVWQPRDLSLTKLEDSMRCALFEIAA